MKGMALVFSFLLIFSSCGREEKPVDPVEEANALKEAEVRQLAQSYVDAINKRDINQIAGMWNEESVYRNPINGELIQGRDGIKKEFSKMFDHYTEGSIALKINTVTFPNEDKAVGEGEMTLTKTGEPAVTRDYEITFVNKNGKWMIYHVSQIDLSVLK